MDTETHTRLPLRIPTRAIELPTFPLDTLDVGVEATRDAADVAPQAGRLEGYDCALQGMSNWCWAAVACSVAHWYEEADWTQCRLVQAELGRQDCCEESPPPPAACNRTWFLNRGLARVKCNRVTRGGRASFARIRESILDGRPVCARIRWTGGGGHFVAIVGFETAGTKVLVADPQNGVATVPHAAFPARYRGGASWTHTFMTRPPSDWPW